MIKQGTGRICFLEQAKVTLTLHCSLLDVQSYPLKKGSVCTVIRILYCQKDRNHHLSLQWVSVATSKITDLKNPMKYHQKKAER